MHEHFEAGRGDALLDDVAQARVLEHPSRQRHRPHAEPASQVGRPLTRRPDRSIHGTTAASTGIDVPRARPATSSAMSGDGSTTSCARLVTVDVDRECTRFGAGHGSGHRFELDRRLRLVGDSRTKTEQRGDRVEQPAHARRHGSLPADDEVAHGVAAAIDEGVIDTGPLCPRHAHPPRLQDRGDSARHRHGREMADSLETTEVRDEELPSPQRAVGAVAESVERQRQHGADPAVLGEARRDVRVVVLHADGSEIEVRRELAREVLRVKIVRDDFGRHRIERAEVVDRLHERPVRGEMLEITDVVARDDLGRRR